MTTATATALPAVPQRPTFTVAAGDPDELSRAATRTAAESDRWRTAGQTVRTAARTAQDGWQGTAQTAFGDYTDQLAGAHATNATAHDQAAQALRRLSGTLSDAQQTGQQATRAWLDAHTRLTAASGAAGAAGTRARQSAQDDLDQANSLGARAQAEYEQNAAQATQRLQNAADQLTPIPTLSAVEHSDLMSTAGPGGGPPRNSTVVSVRFLGGGVVLITLADGRQFRTREKFPYSNDDIDRLRDYERDVLQSRTSTQHLGYRYVDNGDGTILAYEPDPSDESIPKSGTPVQVIRVQQVAVGPHGTVDSQAAEQLAGEAAGDGANEVAIILPRAPSPASQLQMLRDVDAYLQSEGLSATVSIAVPGPFGIYHESWRGKLGSGSPSDNVKDLSAGEAGAKADNPNDPEAGLQDPVPTGEGGDPEPVPEPIVGE